MALLEGCCASFGSNESGHLSWSQLDRREVDAGFFGLRDVHYGLQLSKQVSRICLLS